MPFPPSHSPQPRVSGLPIDVRSENKARITVVNRIVRSVGSGDQVLRIENPQLTVFEILRGNRIHVMHHELSMDLVTGNTEIASLVSEHDQVANMAPFAGAIEPLVEPTIETEGGSTDLTLK